MKTIYRLLKYNRILKSHRIKYAGVLMADILGVRHLSVRIDPILACNLRCRMCYFTDPSWRRENEGVLTHEQVDRIAEMLFPKALQLVIGCAAEPTTYKDFMMLLKLGKTYGVPYVSLVSNGQLLTEKHIDDFIALGLDELMLSTHGVKKETYEYMMPGASHELFMNLLSSLKTAKMRRNSVSPRLRINYTVNPDNLEELKEFFNVYGDFDISVLQIRPVMDMGDTDYANKDMSEYLNAYKDVVGKLANECRDRKIIFMANTADPTYRSDNPTACLREEVLRKVSPKEVWKHDFAWESETYREYCSRTEWRSHLFKSIFASAGMCAQNKRTMTYEVEI